MSYVVFVCSGCGRFLIAKAGQKNKQCNYCGTIVDLWKAKKVRTAGSAREASKLAREFKMKAGE
jgi:LSD1 subclass zinc finger protein